MNWRNVFPNSPCALGCRKFFVVLTVVWGSYWITNVSSGIPLINGVLCELGRLMWTVIITGAIFLWMRYRKIASSRLIKVNSARKAVLITGCDSGFGFETALRLYCDGFYVFAGCLQVGVNGALTLAKVDNGQRLIPLSLDVTKMEDINALFNHVRKILDEKDLELWAVINNAGVTAFCELEFCALDTFRKVLDVNALGTVRISQRFVPLLRKFHGRLIIVSSLAGYLSYPGLTAYCMSKHAIVGLADCIRKEFEKWKIPVSLIVSTGYRTQMLNPTSLIRDMEENWNTASEEVRIAYGGIEYFQQFRRDYLRRLSSVTNHVGEAVDAIISAVQCETPQDVYYTNWRGELRNLARYLPPSWQDIYMMAFESFEPFLSFLSPNQPPKCGRELLDDFIRKEKRSLTPVVEENIGEYYVMKSNGDLPSTESLWDSRGTECNGEVNLASAQD